MTSIDKFIGTEFRSRYINPTWIEGMKKEATPARAKCGSSSSTCGDGTRRSARQLTTACGRKPSASTSRTSTTSGCSSFSRRTPPALSGHHGAHARDRSQGQLERRRGDAEEAARGVRRQRQPPRRRLRRAHVRQREAAEIRDGAGAAGWRSGPGAQASRKRWKRRPVKGSMPAPSDSTFVRSNDASTARLQAVPAPSRNVRQIEGQVVEARQTSTPAQRGPARCRPVRVAAAAAALPILGLLAAWRFGRRRNAHANSKNCIHSAPARGERDTARQRYTSYRTACSRLRFAAWKIGPPAWTDGYVVALGDPCHSLQIVSVISCVERHWQQRRRRRSNACGADLQPSQITPLISRSRPGSSGALRAI